MRTFFKSVLASAIAMVAYGACAGLARAADCPQASIFSSKDAKTYVTHFYDPAPFAGTVDATFYTANGSYRATISDLTIATVSKPGGFLSKSFAFANPTTDAVQGVALSFHGSDGSQTCEQQMPLPKPKEFSSLAQYTAAPAPGPGDVPLALTFVGPEAPLACAQPYALASVVKAVEPEYPQTAKFAGASGTALIHVDVSEDGSVTHTSLFRSTGNQALDIAAIKAATNSSYAPALFRCTPIVGACLFKVDFTMTRM
jgi:TonB family protein